MTMQPSLYLGLVLSVRLLTLFCLILRCSTTPLLEFPGGSKKVVLDIGASVDPMVPRSEDSETHVLAFEPLPNIQKLIPPHPKVSLLPVAVGDSTGLSIIHEYGDAVASQSSSLARIRGTSELQSTGTAHVVIVLSLADVLRSIPDDVEIELVKTDIQGLDFKVIKSAGEELRARKVKMLTTEVYLENSSSYEGVDNDFCLHWKGYMESLGYKLVGLKVMHSMLSDAEISALCTRKYEPSTSVKEGNAYWQLEGTASTSLESFEYPTIMYPEVLDEMVKLWTPQPVKNEL